MEEQRIILHNGDNAALERDVTITDTTTWKKRTFDKLTVTDYYSHAESSHTHLIDWFSDMDSQLTLSGCQAVGCYQDKLKPSAQLKKPSTQGRSCEILATLLPLSTHARNLLAQWTSLLRGCSNRRPSHINCRNIAITPTTSSGRPVSQQLLWSL